MGEHGGAVLEGGALGKQGRAARVVPWHGLEQFVGGRQFAKSDVRAVIPTFSNV